MCSEGERKSSSFSDWSAFKPLPPPAWNSTQCQAIMDREVSLPALCPCRDTGLLGLRERTQEHGSSLVVEVFVSARKEQGLASV